MKKLAAFLVICVDLLLYGCESNAYAEKIIRPVSSVFSEVSETSEYSIEQSSEETSSGPSFVPSEEASNESSEESIEESIEESSEEQSDEFSDESSEESIEESVEESSEESSETHVMTGEEYNRYMIDKYSGVTVDSIKKSDIDTYFENSVIVGNSVIVHFLLWLRNRRFYCGDDFMGGMQVFASSAYGAYCNNLPKITKYHPEYNGVQYNIADGVAAMGVDTVYLSVMTLNDMGHRGLTNCYNDNVQMIESVIKKNPKVKVVIISSTYLTKGYNGKNLNNKNISILNNMILDYCDENGLDFLDISTANMTYDGYLRSDLCIDKSGVGCHVSNNAYCVWTAVFRDYAEAKKNGTWKNPAEMPRYDVPVDLTK